MIRIICYGRLWVLTVFLTLLTGSVAAQERSWEKFDGLVEEARIRPDGEEKVAAYRVAIAAGPEARSVVEREKISDAHRGLGVVLRRLDRLEEAVTEHREAIRLRPAFAEAHANLAVALHRLGRYGVAVEAYREAIRLEPNQATFRRNLGLVLDHWDRLREAAAALKEAIRLRPNDEVAHARLGVVFEKMGRHSEAVRSFRKAIDLNPKDGESHANLGVSLFRLGHYEESLAACSEAVRLRPDLAEAYRNLGSVLEKLGRSEEATLAYREGLRLRPDLEMPAPAPFFGLILENLGGYDDALAEHYQMIRLKPGYPVAHFNLGTTLRKLGRLEEAAEEFREALRVGRPEWAYETLARQALDEVRSMIEDERRLTSLRSARAGAQVPQTDAERETTAGEQIRLGNLFGGGGSRFSPGDSIKTGPCQGPH